ncbi:hypothetical protein V1279_003103 [Bradyrhizobium sp. AZCC 1610]
MSKKANDDQQPALPDWTDLPTCAAVLKDMRNAAERRRLREAEEQAKAR